MEKFICSKKEDLSSLIFKYEKKDKFFKCYSSLAKDNKIVYIQCYPLYENEDIKLRKIEKKLNGYYVI